MRKSILLVPLLLFGLSQNALAERATLYIGLDLFGSWNAFDFEAHGDHERPHIDGSGFKLKFGALLEEGFGLQGYVLGETFDEPLFDYSNDQLFEMGLELTKAFYASPYVFPFIQGGFGFGSMPLDSAYYPDDDAIGEYSFKIGAGLLFRIAPQVELLTGIDLQWRTWQDIVYTYPSRTTLTTEDISQRFYVGANFLF